MPNEYYHVRITLKSRRTHDAVELDLAEEDILKNIVAPYSEGKKFLCGGEIIDPFDIEQIRINVTADPSSVLLPQIREERRRSGAVVIGIPDEWYVTKKGEEVTRKFINSPPSEGQVKTVKEVEYDPTKIFIVHGHDDTSKLELARILENFGLEPIILHEQASEGKTVIEKFEKHASNVGYAFILLTPDDMCSSSKNELKGRARQNVILELGYFMGKLGRGRVCCLYKGEVELPSDILGIIYIKFQNTVKECYEEIIKELKNAGYKPNI